MFSSSLLSYHVNNLTNHQGGNNNGKITFNVAVVKGGANYIFYIFTKYFLLSTYTLYTALWLNV